MKKRLLMFMSIVMVFVLSCGKNHITVKTFEKEMKAYQSGDLNEMRKIKPEEFHEGSEEELGFKIMSEALKKLEYKINDVKIKDGVSTINVTLKGPDLSSVASIYKERALKLLTENYEEYSKFSQEQRVKHISSMLQEIISEELKKKDLKTIEKTYNVKYKKEGKNWKLINEEEISEFFTFGIKFK